jgi:hypothetical protein
VDKVMCSMQSSPEKAKALRFYPLSVRLGVVAARDYGVCLWQGRKKKQGSLWRRQSSSMYRAPSERVESGFRLNNAERSSTLWLKQRNQPELPIG